MAGLRCQTRKRKLVVFNNIEEFPLHFGALCVLVALAAHRRNLFPFVLVFMYAAFFCINESYQDALVSKVLLESTLAAMLCMVAIESKRRRYIKRFCLLMILSILNNILMLLLSVVLYPGEVYVAAQISTALISASLSLAEFYILVRIIYGTGRGEPIFTIFIINIMDGLSIFTPSKKALPSYFWQKGAANSYREAGQR